MAQFIAPGVYVLERDFSDYVAALSQTACGLVGTSQRGPLDEPTFISSVEQYLNTFGEPDVNQYGPHAAVNYLRRGNQLWYVRIARTFDENAAAIDSLGAPDPSGNIFVFDVEPGHGLNLGDYIRISQTGKATTQNVLITDLVSNTITINAPLLAAYDPSSSSDSVIDKSTGGTAAANAETFAVSRRSNTVTPVVKFTAKDPGDYANFGSGNGIEVRIEDGGQFANLDPTTGNPITSSEGIPLQGIVPNAPSVDTKYDLIALTSDDTRVGEMRGVNYDSIVRRVTAVADNGGDLQLTIGDNSGFNIGDDITIAGTSAYDGTGYTVLTIDGADKVTISGYAGVITAGAEVGFLENTDSQHFGVVYRCSAVFPTYSEWEARGVLTKRVKVLYKGNQVEVFDNLIGYDPTSTNYWDTVIGSPTNGDVSDYIHAEYLGSEGEQPINTYDRIRHPNNPRLVMGLAVEVRVSDSGTAAIAIFNNAKGFNGDNPDAADYIGTIDPTTNTYTGLQNFRKTNQIDINIMAVPGVVLPSVLNEMITVLNVRNDCLGIVDPPMGLSPQQVVDWHNGEGDWTGLHSAFTTNRAALYYPWVKQFDPYSNSEVWLPPTCFLPAVIAYNDQIGETWFAPAGIIRGKVDNALVVESVVEQGDVDFFYGPGNGNAVNPIQQFATDGIVVYGNRTLQRFPSALDRVNVRRLLFFIEKSVATAARRLVFEQNDPVLWAQFVNLIDPVLASLEGRRALEWYKVVSDASVNNAQRRNNNEAVAKIYLIPVKSAEKIILDFTLLASGARVEEFIQQDIEGQFTT